MAAQPKFFLDRGLGSRILADGLRRAGWRVETMDERYGTAASQLQGDPEWIPEAAQRGDAILCKDRAVTRNPLEAQAIHMNDAKVFVITSQNVTGAVMLDWVLANEEEIFQWAARRGPFACGIHPRKLERLKLNYP